MLLALVVQAGLPRAEEPAAAGLPAAALEERPFASPQTYPSLVQQPPEPPPRPELPRYFYFGYDYGTQSLYSPLWVFVNRGYDVLQDRVASRNVFDLEYRQNAGNVLDNLAHPFSRIPEFGWKAFVTQELLPLSYTKDTVRWVPNYALHLIGGGTTYTALTEWFQAHDVPLPRVFSALTVLAAAFLNETIENKGVVGTNTDCIADIYFFDLGGILLFSFDAPNRLFSHYVTISDWSLQPTFTLPQGELHNQGNYFAAKWPLPFYPRLRLFTWFGEATTGGLSFAINEELSVSAVVGGAAVHLVNQNTGSVRNTVDFARTAAVFIDRRNSLLASLQVTDVDDYFIHLNVYPHALTPRGPAAGFWAVIDRHGRAAVGISLSRLLGMGIGYSGL